MCGISGLWFKSEIENEVLNRYGYIMGNALSHRGPDGEGFWSDIKSSILFSHRRLSIRDLSLNGSQPMKSHDDNLIMIFNGEIYNFQELKKELNFNDWKSSSDTEVLLFAIQEWGLKKALKKCYGMFSIALWDIKHKKLTLARDRFGEKPLYWGYIKINGIKDSILGFTSDLKSFWSIPRINKEIDYDTFSDYLKYGYIHAPRSIHKNIHQLLPGHLVEISSNDGFAPQNLNEPVCWWDINEVSNQCYSCQSNEESFLLLEETLKKVLKQQQLADVPTAAFLSGGIDSSLITALLQSESSKKVKTFNISFPDNGNGEEIFDEGPYAKKISTYLGTEHTEIPLSFAEIKSVIPKLPNIYSEPFSDSSQIATFLICEGIKSNGIKVALGGDGADELFGGYNRHVYGPLIYKKFHNINPYVTKFLSNILKVLPFDNKSLTQEKIRKLSAALKKSNNINYIYDVILSSNLNTNKFHKFIQNESSYLIDIKSIDAPTNSERFMIADTSSYLPNDILVKLDRASMYLGLETRSPYLDERVAKIAWSLNLNEKIKTQNRTLIRKWPLKNILYKYIPKEYFDRPKSGFSIPISSWLRGPLKEWAYELLESKFINKQEYLCGSKVQKLWQSHLNGNSENTELIWSILMWQAWITNWDNQPNSSDSVQ